MAVNIYQGTTLLDDKGFYRDGQAYIPSQAIHSFSGIYDERTVFVDSPLAGKVLCIAILNSTAGAAGFTPNIERFFQLCSAAGAYLAYHDGCGYPAGDIILTIESGIGPIGVKYLGYAFRSRPLARKIATNLKRGLALAYLPDPAPFDKPQYNLKVNFWSRIFTPAVAIQWPEELDLGPWLFASLMEYGSSSEMNVLPLFPPLPEDTPTPVEQVHPDPIPDPDPPPPPTLESIPSATVLPEPEPQKVLAEAPRRPASMSLAAYPELTVKPLKRNIKKKPFT